MFRTLLLASGGLLLALPAASQSFNLDVGDGNLAGPPASGYGAAAFQPGTWNLMTDGLGLPLVDLAGQPTTVSVSATGTNFGFWFDNDLTFGDDELLLDDLCDGARTYTFTGLASSTYRVITYAWGPDSPVFKTNVTVQGAAEPDQIVGGTWTGKHVLGVTFARHTVVVSTGEIVVSCAAVAGFASINGFQVVDLGGGCPSPTVYCTAKPNSLGCSPVLAWTGAPSASAHDGFVVTYGPVPGANIGLFVYSTQGAAGTPIQNPFGFLCVNTSGLFRTPPVPSGGLFIFCDGEYAIDFNQYFASQGPDPSLVVGATVDMQCWYRDPPNPGTANLSNAISFSMCP